MKKLLCALLVAVMLIGCFAAFAESDSETTYFEATITNGLDQSISQWYGTSYNRALLTWLLILDYGVATGNMGAIDLEQNTYVSDVGDGTAIGVLVRTTGDQDLMMYYFGGDMAFYGYVSTSTDSLTESTLAQVCTSYYKNNVQDMLDVAEMISGILNS